MKSYYYAGYSDTRSTGLHHRSDTFAGAVRHMENNNQKVGERNRFVAMVTGTYFPPRASSTRGNLAQFVAANLIEVMVGASPAMLADLATVPATVPAPVDVPTLPATPTVPATVAVVPNGAVLVDVLASVANRSHVRPVSTGAGNVRLALATAAARIGRDVYDPAGSATASPADDEVDDRTARRIARRMRLASVGIGAIADC